MTGYHRGFTEVESRERNWCPLQNIISIPNWKEIQASKTHKTGRNEWRGWHRKRGGNVDYLWGHPRCASWSCCWSGLEVLIRVVNVYWRWQPHTSLRNKQRGKHPGNREAVNHHPGTYKSSYKHVPHSYFTPLLDSASQHIQDTQVSTRR